MSAQQRAGAATAGMLVAILASAFNLRVAVVAVGPVIEEVRADTHMSSAVAGVLTTIPFVCQAIFSFAGIALVRRYRAERLITISLALLAAGTVLRAAMPTPLLLILATVPIGIAIAITAVALPGVVKEHYPGRAGAVTGAYVSSLSVGAALAALGVVPLADAFGGWRWAFAATALAVVPALVLWIQALPPPADPAPGDTVLPSLRPSRTGVLLALVFGTQSICFSGTITWVAALYIDAGWDRGDAALALAVIPLATIAVALTVPALSDRGGRPAWVIGTAATMTVGLLGLALAPEALALGWVLLFALGNGAIFALLLTLPLDLRGSPSGVMALSAWMQGGGYAFTAVGPVLVGAMRDATGGFQSAFLVLAALSATCMLLSLLVARQPRTD